jgi:hypothetical protein
MLEVGRRPRTGWRALPLLQGEGEEGARPLGKVGGIARPPLDRAAELPGRALYTPFV